MIVYDAAGVPITLLEEIARGGEGTFYRAQGRAGQVAKLYHTYRPEYEEKLRWMMAHPPVSLSGSGLKVAWPQMLLFNAQARFAGFLMGRIQPLQPLSVLWEPTSEPATTLKARHQAAYKLARTVEALHAQGYVLGMLSADEVLALPPDGVILIETDSYQLRIPQLVGSTLFMAPVGPEGYTPPERQGLTEAAELTPPHDHFALAVLIFQLLLDGVHPFDGEEESSKSSAAQGRAIEAGWYPHARAVRGPRRPPPKMPSLDTLHPELATLFERCFVEGHHRPRMRPSATEWAETLALAERSLVSCPRGHYRLRQLIRCPECVRIDEEARQRASAQSSKANPGAWVQRLSLVIFFVCFGAQLLGNVWDSITTDSYPQPISIEPTVTPQTFDRSGVITTDLGGNDVARSIVVQPDGKLVVGGNTGRDFVLVRYLPDGRLDSDFGSDGRALTPNAVSEVLRAIAIQPDGKLVAAGYTTSEVILVRYLPDGRLDESFGVQGSVRTRLDGYYSVIKALVVQPDGSIVVAGSRNLFGAEEESEAILLRYNPDGTLDTRFGTDGLVIMDAGAESEANTLLLQPDGKLVMGGAMRLSSGADPIFVVARYDSLGRLDPTFGGAGIVRTEIEQGAGRLFDLALRPDGKLVASGLLYLRENGVASTRLALVRYHPDGVMDETFGTSSRGNTEEDVSDPQGHLLLFHATQLLLEPDGSLTVLGMTRDVQDLALARYSEDGVPDLEFGLGGKLILQEPERRYYDLALHPEGGLLVAGEMHSDFMLIRVEAEHP